MGGNMQLFLSSTCLLNNVVFLIPRPSSSGLTFLLKTCLHNYMFMCRIRVAQCTMSVSGYCLCDVLAVLKATFWFQLWHFFPLDSRSFIVTGAEEKVQKKRALLPLKSAMCFDKKAFLSCPKHRAHLIELGLHLFLYSYTSLINTR